MVKKACFEKVSRFNDVNITMPSRGTISSAGYDLFVAEEIVLPPYKELMHNFTHNTGSPMYGTIMNLDEMKSITKTLGVKPSLVSLGVKCKLPIDKQLKLVPRSSTPLNYWIICANSQGTIDADYYNNEKNEGEIFFEAINLSPYPIRLKVGDCICQGIISSYDRTDDDKVREISRVGGFGSTT